MNNVSSGANPNATKALVIITDGDPSDNDYYNVLNKSDQQNILRYIIGVSWCQMQFCISLFFTDDMHNTMRQYCEESR